MWIFGNELNFWIRSQCYREQLPRRGRRAQPVPGKRLRAEPWCHQIRHAPSIQPQHIWERCRSYLRRFNFPHLNYFSSVLFINLPFSFAIFRVKLDSPLDLSVSTAAAISMPAAGEQTPAGTTLTVSGWGTTRVNLLLIEALRVH